MDVYVLGREGVKSPFIKHRQKNMPIIPKRNGTKTNMNGAPHSKELNPIPKVMVHQMIKKNPMNAFAALGLLDMYQILENHIT